MYDAKIYTSLGTNGEELPYEPNVGARVPIIQVQMVKNFLMN
jgi:hypothetical protein